jgi:hypothetical protein
VFFEPVPPVKSKGFVVSELYLQMQGFHAVIWRLRNDKLNRKRTRPLPAEFLSDKKFIQKSIPPPEFKRKTKAEQKVADDRPPAENYPATAKMLFLNELKEVLPGEGEVKRVAVNFVEILHHFQKKRDVTVRNRGKSKVIQSANKLSDAAKIGKGIR